MILAKVCRVELECKRKKWVLLFLLAVVMWLVSESDFITTASSYSAFRYLPTIYVNGMVIQSTTAKREKKYFLGKLLFEEKGLKAEADS